MFRSLLLILFLQGCIEPVAPEVALCPDDLQDELIGCSRCHETRVWINRPSGRNMIKIYDTITEEFLP